MTTINQNTSDNFYGFPERICDNCDCLIEGQMHLHWDNKDFDLCSDCLMENYQKVFEPFSNNEKNKYVYKKVSIPTELRWKIWRRDNYICQYCGINENLSVDHIIPEVNGGELLLNNLVTACKKCNSKKSNRTPEEAGMQLINDPRE